MKASPTMIRSFQHDDTDALVSIWQSANSLAHPFLKDAYVAQVAADIRNIYLPNAETWVMEDNGTPVGFIAMIDNEIGGLFLAPSCHGRGFGRAMVDHVRAERQMLTVEVFEKNAIGRRFYESYGFRLADTMLHPPTGEQVLKLALTNV